MKDMSGLTSNDTLDDYVRRHNGRFPTKPIPNDPKPLKTPNKALKVFENKKDINV